MCNIPVEVASSETLVRCVCSPFHHDGKKLLWKAFYPRKDVDGVSVIRADYLTSDECKKHGKSLSNPAQNKTYKGLAVVNAGSVRDCGAEVVDSREIFCGHADILHGHVMPDGEPAPPHVLEEVVERCKKLLSRSTFHADPQPEGQHWTGTAFIN